MAESENIDQFSQGPEGAEESYFAYGIDPDDISPFWNLKQKSPLLNAFAALFQGPETYTLLRLLVLAEMVSKLNHPSWAMGELRHAFSYLSEKAFETVLRRLRDGGLIDYDRETNSYSVTPLGQKAHSSISLFLKTEEDDGVGMLTGMIYAGEVAGTLGKEELGHLLYRLNQLESELVEAIESSSEHRIIKARQRYETIWKYIEKGTDVIKRLTKDIELDRATHRLAQQIGLAQSRLTKFTSVFQRVLNDMDRQRVHLGSSGVSTSDIDNYLMRFTVDKLIELLEGAVGTFAEPAFLLTDVMADIGEYEIIEKEREKPEDWLLPKPVVSPSTEDALFDDMAFLGELHADVSSIEENAALKSFVPKRNYEESAYRLSMVSIIGDKGEFGTGQMADFINLPFVVSSDASTDEVLKDGVKSMSKGHLKRKHDA